MTRFWVSFFLMLTTYYYPSNAVEFPSERGVSNLTGGSHNSYFLVTFHYLYLGAIRVLLGSVSHCCRYRYMLTSLNIYFIIWTKQEDWFMKGHSFTVLSRAGCRNEEADSACVCSKITKRKKNSSNFNKKTIIQVIATSQFKSINDFVFVLTRERQWSFDNCLDIYLAM